MTSKRYLGNIITDTPTAPAGPYSSDVASGVWSLAEQRTYSAAGLWPTAGNVNPANLGLYLSSTNAGNPSTYGSQIRSFGFSSLGSSSDFGDTLSSYLKLTAAVASTTRAVFGGGFESSTFSNVLQYVTLLSAGNSTDFGDLTVGRYTNNGAHSNSTRGIFAGGNISGGRTNVIDYITIASTGNATDFGDLSNTMTTSGTGSSTRAIWAGGFSSSQETNEIQYVTIASTGNASNFGSLLGGSRQGVGACSSATRAVMAGGYSTGAGAFNNIEYVTIASTGNTTDFGDLSSSETGANCASTSNGTIGVYLYSTFENSITIASTGNGTAFSDSGVVHQTTATSGGHGGLQ